MYMNISIIQTSSRYYLRITEWFHTQEDNSRIVPKTSRTVEQRLRTSHSLSNVRLDTGVPEECDVSCAFHKYTSPGQNPRHLFPSTLISPISFSFTLGSFRITFIQAWAGIPLYSIEMWVFSLFQVMDLDLGLGSVPGFQIQYFPPQSNILDNCNTLPRMWRWADESSCIDQIGTW